METNDIVGADLAQSSTPREHLDPAGQSAGVCHTPEQIVPRADCSYTGVPEAVSKPSAIVAWSRLFGAHKSQVLQPDAAPAEIAAIGLDAPPLPQPSANVTTPATPSTLAPTIPTKRKSSPAVEPEWKRQRLPSMDSSGAFELDHVRPWQAAWETADEYKKWIRVRGGLVYCLYCRATKQHNVFNTGIPVTDSWDKTKLSQHCRKACKKHADALGGYQAATNMATNLKSSRKRKLDSMKDSLMVIVQCVFWLSYECIASCKLRSLYKFVRKLPGMPKLQSVNDLTYANAARAREFTMSLSSILKGYLWKDLLASPFVSVLIDESTDISTSENMIIYFIYLKAGVAVVTYAAMVHVPAVDAASITDTLLVFFT